MLRLPRTCRSHELTPPTAPPPPHRTTPAPHCCTPPQENYVNHAPKIVPRAAEAQRLQILAKAADGISLGDLATRAVRQHQNWALMPFAVVMGTVYPATYMRGQRETFGLFPGETNFPRFTAWLGSNSSSGKQRRLLGELHTRMLSSGGIECDRWAGGWVRASSAVIGIGSSSSAAAAAMDSHTAEKCNRVPMKR